MNGAIFVYGLISFVCSRGYHVIGKQIINQLLVETIAFTLLLLFQYNFIDLIDS